MPGVDVVHDAQRADQVQALVDGADPTADGGQRTGGQPRHLLPEHLHLARGWAHGARAEPQQGRLAGTAGPDQGHPLAGPDMQVDVTERRQTAVGHAHPAQRDDRGRHDTSPSLRPISSISS